MPTPDYDAWKLETPPYLDGDDEDQCRACGDPCTGDYCPPCLAEVRADAKYAERKDEGR